MMAHFSKTSKAKLATCHHILQLLFNHVIKTYDCTVVEGHRGKELQDEYFLTGRSRVKYPKGKHNKYPSEAVDVVPFVGNTASFDSNNCIYFAGYVQHCFIHLQDQGLIPTNVKLRNGADWNMDGVIYEGNDLKDPYHFELIWGD